MALNKPVEQPSKETILSVLKAADRIRRHFTEILKPFGLTLQQFNVLRILRGAGPQGLPTLEVGERMIEKTPGATRLLDRLEEKGLVSRQRCHEDRRQQLCTRTQAALDLLAELDEPIVQGDRDTLANLTAQEENELKDLASRILQ
ncbi:MAG: MarR family transcriptional regulator [Thermoanaerobaculia bacterium]|jgi:DNA-binding MarR family transcriptional regulator